LSKQLSGGFKRRLTLAMTLLCDSDLLVLDEPTTSLDIVSREEVFKSLMEIQELGKTLFFTTHNLEEAERFAD
jgi:ABC-2 type transport system ATP-binding protein